MLLTLALCLGMIPTASAAQQNSYHDPVEHWQQASNRTNELDVNAIVTHETFYCAGKIRISPSGVFRSIPAPVRRP